MSLLGPPVSLLGSLPMSLKELGQLWDHRWPLEGCHQARRPSVSHPRSSMSHPGPSMSHPRPALVPPHVPVPPATCPHVTNPPFPPPQHDVPTAAPVLVPSLLHPGGGGVLFGGGGIALGGGGGCPLSPCPRRVPAGAGGLPAGRAQGTGEPQDGPGATHQDVGIRPQTGEVGDTPKTQPCVPRVVCPPPSFWGGDTVVTSGGRHLQVQIPQVEIRHRVDAGGEETGGDGTG